jgi:chemotaxis protein CheD
MNGVAANAIPPAPARIVIGIGDMRVAHGVGQVIMTHALGSCLGITVHDPVACVGGMLHALLPDSTTSPERAAENPLAFVDTGVPRLFRALYAIGADKRRVILRVAGGASMQQAGGSENDYFQVGSRNLLALRKLLWKNGVLIKAQDTGGSISRTMSLDVGTGVVTISTGGVSKVL